MSLHLADAVPILNQPFTIKGWFLTLSILCQCGEPVMLVGQPGAGSKCACGRTLVFHGIRETQGQIGFAIGSAPAPLGLDS